MRLDDVRVHYPDARHETDGSIVFECPLCRVEGRLGKLVKLYINGAISCPTYAGMPDANREHCRPIRETLGQISNPRQAFIEKVLFDGKLILEVAQAERGKVRLVARNCVSVFIRDVISLDRAKERNDFIKGILEVDDNGIPNFDDKQLKDIDQVIKQLGD